MEMPGRKWAASNYRYSHNGQEKESELFTGANSAEYWMYDSRLGRRWERDPIVNSSISPYACFANNPIRYSDLKGLEPGDGDKTSGTSSKSTVPLKMSNTDLPEVTVTTTKPGFWNKVGDFFKGLGNGIRNVFRSLDKLIDKFTDKINKSRLGQRLQQFERERMLEHDDHPTKSRNKDEIPGEGKLSPQNTQEESQPVFPFSGPKSTYEDPSDPNNTPSNEQKSLIKKQNDSTIIHNVRNPKDGTLIDIKVPKDVPQGEDTKGIIIKGKNKGKEFIYIDNPPLGK